MSKVLQSGKICVHNTVWFIKHNVPFALVIWDALWTVLRRDHFEINLMCVSTKSQRLIFLCVSLCVFVYLVFN